MTVPNLDVEYEGPLPSFQCASPSKPAGMDKVQVTLAPGNRLPVDTH